MQIHVVVVQIRLELHDLFPAGLIDQYMDKTQRKVRNGEIRQQIVNRSSEPAFWCFG